MKDDFLYWYHGVWVKWHRWAAVRHWRGHRDHAHAIEAMKENYRHVTLEATPWQWRLVMLRAHAHHKVYLWRTWRMYYHGQSAGRHLDRQYVLAGADPPERDPQTGIVKK